MRTFSKFIVLFFLVAGCVNMKPEAVGSFNSVYVFVDDFELSQLREPLEISLERPIITPRPERLFRLQWCDTSSLDNATKHHIVFIAASLSSPGDWGAYIRMNLSPQALDSVKKGKYNLFVKRDVWARNQILIILTAPTADALRDYVLSNTDKIFKIVNDYCNENVAKWLFGKFEGRSEKFDIEKKIAVEYGFGIRVPRMFDWEKGKADEHFIWLRALEPERWVFVWWTALDSADAGKISLKWFTHIRDSLCAVYYEGDSLQQGFLTYERTTLDGLPGIMYRSRWFNSKKSLGGPVVGFILDDVENSRRYILDGAVFAPGIKKEPYLRHCEVILRSFSHDAKKFLDVVDVRKNQ
ncbi:DUF4837 family protein [bacterium]|nr:DUF4837 family protein [bacterium]